MTHLEAGKGNLPRSSRECWPMSVVRSGSQPLSKPNFGIYYYLEYNFDLVAWEYI